MDKELLEIVSDEIKPTEGMVKEITKEADLAVHPNTEPKESSKTTVDEVVIDDQLLKEDTKNKDFKIEDQSTDESKQKETNITSQTETKSKSSCSPTTNTIIENFKRNLQFISSHPKFCNLHAQTMKLLSCELSKNVDSEILKAKLIKKDLGYLVKELEERELGFLFFDGLDEKSIGNLSSSFLYGFI